MSQPSHHYAQATLGCSTALPLALLDTSAPTDWTSLLLNHHEGAGEGPTFETQRTDDLSLTIDASGRPEVLEFIDGRWQSAMFQPGIVCLTPRGETARVRLRSPAASEAFRTIHVYLPGSLVDDVADEYRRIGQTSSNNRIIGGAYRDEVLARTGAALLGAHRSGAPDLYAASAATWMVTHLLSQQAGWRHLADDPRVATTIADRRLARVIEYMSDNLERHLTLDDLAREAGISVHHFGRRFRELTGMGPATYLTELRMERARRLLKTTDLPVADVALRSGYPRPSAFSTAFLRQTGVTPRRFRSPSGG